MVSHRTGWSGLSRCGHRPRREKTAEGKKAADYDSNLRCRHLRILAGSVEAGPEAEVNNATNEKDIAGCTRRVGCVTMVFARPQFGVVCSGCVGTRGQRCSSECSYRDFGRFRELCPRRSRSPRNCNWRAHGGQSEAAAYA